MTVDATTPPPARRGTQGDDQSPLLREEGTERREGPGKIIVPDGCSHEARGAAGAAPGFTTSQGRRWVRTSPKGSMAPAFPHSGFAGAHPFIVKVSSERTGMNAPRASAQA